MAQEELQESKLTKAGGRKPTHGCNYPMVGWPSVILTPMGPSLNLTREGTSRPSLRSSLSLSLSAFNTGNNIDSFGEVVVQLMELFAHLGLVYPSCGPLGCRSAPSAELSCHSVIYRESCFVCEGCSSQGPCDV